MDNIYFIIFFAVLSIIFIFLAIIINVRSKESIITKKKEPDFIDNFISKKTNQLKKIPGSIKIKTYLTLLVVLPIVFGLGSWFLLKTIWLSVVFAVISSLIPEFLVNISRNAQRKHFEERYARALRQISSSLRAGMTLQQAVEDLCASPFIHYEIKKEFRQVDSDIKMGISVPDAFDAMADRLPTDDVKDVASAIRMQSLVGGSEAESIEMISTNISSRLMLRKEIKTLFASVKMTIIGMDILPVFIIALLYFSTPAYFKPLLSSTLGRLVLIVSAVLMLIGSYIDRKFITKVKGVDK